MRCHICGRHPSEEHNVKTHEAHYRMWEKLASNQYDGHAQRVFESLKR